MREKTNLGSLGTPLGHLSVTLRHSRKKKVLHVYIEIGIHQPKIQKVTILFIYNNKTLF